MTLLTGCAAGARDATGHYPEGTINNRVETKLQLYAETLRRFGKQDTGSKSEDGGDEAL